MKYRTVSGESVDEITWRHYGTTRGSTELVLETNTGLAEHGPTLPGGLVIELPEFEAPKMSRGVRLWD